MSTSGYVVRYAPAPLAEHVAPLRGARPPALAKALYAVIPKKVLDGDSLDAVEEGNADWLLLHVFAARCVAPDEPHVPLGTYATLKSLRAPPEVARLLQAWEDHPAALGAGEYRAVPAPRALLEALRAAAPDVAPLAPVDAESEPDGLQRLLRVVAWTVEETADSLCTYFELFPAPHRDESHAPLPWEKAAKKRLKDAGLPVWSFRHPLEEWLTDRPGWEHDGRPGFVWGWVAEGDQAAHGWATSQGEVWHFVPVPPFPFFRRLLLAVLQPGTKPGGLPTPARGPCGAAGCRLCAAAAEMAEMAKGWAVNGAS